MSAAADRQGAHALWMQGRLYYKLYPHQRTAYDKIDAVFSKGRKRFVLNWSRRLGKTFFGLVRAVETCLRKRGARVLVAAPSGKHLEEFVHPAMRFIFKDAPPECSAEWKEKESAYIFLNGSRIVMAGCDTQRKADALRGPAADGAVLEEAGSIPNLNYVRRSIIAPQLMSTGGWMLFISTPPVSIGHEFVTIAKQNERMGSYMHLTIWDGQYSRDWVLKEIAQEADGVPVEEYMESVDYRREFLAEFVTDPNKAVLKYATEKHIGSKDKPGTVILRFRDLSRPGRFAGYAGMDVGWSPDATGVVWGYWHAPARTLVIERELKMLRMTTNELASELLRVETELWGPSRRTPYREGFAEPRRWSDHDPKLLADLAGEYGLVWAPTPKDDRDAAVDALNKMIPGYKGHLAVSPDGCPELLAQMQAAIWNNKRTEFARSEAYQHFDLVAALVYLARNVVQLDDPFPEHWGRPNNTHSLYVPDETPRKTEAEKWASMYDMGGAK